MPTESPFREEDLPARIDALRAERDALARALERALREGARRGPWSWGRFFLGLALLPVSIVASGLLLALFN